MGDANNSFTNVNLGTAAVPQYRITQDVDMVTARINYRFGEYGAPIATRYRPRAILTLEQRAGRNAGLLLEAYISKESPSLRLQPQLYKLADGFLRLDCTFPRRLS